VEGDIETYHDGIGRRPMTSVARSSGDISCKATDVNVTCWGSDYVFFDIYRLFFFF